VEENNGLGTISAERETLKPTRAALHIVNGRVPFTDRM
jgi:hypothetical protein